MNRKLFNEDALTAWQEISPDNWRDHVNDLIDVFLDAGIIQYEKLTRAWHDGDLKVIKSTAHTLKSSCGMLGAEVAHDILNQIENSKENTLEDYSPLITNFVEIFEETKAAIEAYRTKGQAA